MTTTDLFGERNITIQGNPALEWVANLILHLIDREPELLNGSRIAEIDRKIRIAAWLENGLGTILPSDKQDEFHDWMCNPKRCIDPDLLSRARRYLVQHDHIRLPSKAIQDGERQRARLSSTFKGG